MDLCSVCFPANAPFDQTAAEMLYQLADAVGLPIRGSMVSRF